MTELNKTIAFVAVAVLLMGAALWGTPSPTLRESAFKDQGEPFFPDFKDPLDCTSLEVVEYDASTAEPKPFKVMFKDGKWVIPSHHNYPADAKDRLARTAAGVIDLYKDTIRSDRAEDQEAMGVIDPLDTKTTSLKGRGKRVTLRNKSDEVLADFIIGDEVRNKPEQRYVRVPGQKRIYGVNVKVDLSTRFADWIETDLLKVDTGKVRRLTFDTHKVIPELGRVEPGEVIKAERKDASGDWKLANKEIGKDEEVNSEKLSTLLTSLADLKIVGVRPKPAGLTEDLKTSDSFKLSDVAVLSLQSKGFYMTRDGRLVSNQGDLLVSTEEGVIYTLRFGEVVFASGEELSAGVADEKNQADQGKDKGKGQDKARKGPEGTAENRYLFVTVSFDPSLVPEPKPAADAQDGLPEDVFERAKDDPKRVAAERAAKEKEEKAEAEHRKKIDEGKKRVKELSDRFAAWYYVIPGDSFRNLMLDGSALVRKKGEKPDATPGGLPGMGGAPGAGGLPPGLNLPGLSPPR